VKKVLWLTTYCLFSFLLGANLAAQEVINEIASVDSVKNNLLKSGSSSFTFTVQSSDLTPIDSVKVKPDSTVFGFLPAISYTSDFGFFAGGVINYYNFGQNEKPFKNQWIGAAILSTKGYVQLQSFYEVARHFDTDFRALYDVSLLRLLQNNYFGTGNNSPFDEERWLNKGYFYESRSFSFYFKGRYPLYKKENDIKRFDLLALNAVLYEYSLDKTDSAQVSIQNPRGFGSSYLTTIGSGFFWENRDNEFLPTSGNWTEFQVSGTIPGISKDLNVAISLRTHHYYTFHFIWDLTIAGRLYWRHVAGNAPFWYLSDPGTNSTLRGYPYRRFLDKGALTGNLELRTWLYEFKSVNIKIGGYFFADAGRVFGDFKDYANVFNDLHSTYGFAGTMSLFNPNFFLRGEMGWSDEISRFYMGVGYLF